MTEDTASRSCHGAKRCLAEDGWRNIAISLIDTQKGEEKAHACAIAWLQQLRLESLSAQGYRPTRLQSKPKMKRLPKIIPPRSRVRLVKADQKTPEWRTEIGREFRIGYYSRQDGLDCIWLVNEQGEYEQTTDRDALLRYFTIEELTDERDYYGAKKRKLTALKSKKANKRRKLV